MTDVITEISGSKVQHGKYNDRIYVMHLNVGHDVSLFLAEIEKLALDNGYSKIFAKVPARFSREFSGHGFEVEASIPGYFGNNDSCLFMSGFYSPERNSVAPVLKAEIDGVQAACMKKKNDKIGALPGEYMIKIVEEKDVPKACAVYRQVFEHYPFPISDENYLISTMKENIVYYACYSGDEIVSMASCEIDVYDNNVELTDFATPPAHRGHNFSYHVMKRMEDDMKKQGKRIAFTIARALSAGMNISFARNGYRFSGLLVNNTRIATGFESMNVWYKQL
ncbi:MAG: putative beta-lysine N-acetyltransferase [Oligoflexia bacterium]|nr:putative beta-lysine N-acetyltransferase [Oligoflexia bacterium]